MDEEIKIKAIFLGEQGIGKTSIIKRIIGDGFDEKIKPTLQIRFYS